MVGNLLVGILGSIDLLARFFQKNCLKNSLHIKGVFQLKCAFFIKKSNQVSITHNPSPYNSSDQHSH